MTSRILMIGLDGFEPTFAVRLIAEGKLPTFQRLREQSAFAALDHGDSRRTGLAWEHVATGLSPDDASRWAAVDFDSVTYRAWQRPTELPPFPAKLPLRTLVFDAPYFDLERAQHVQGLVAWGAHDPGVPQAARPAGLAEELELRFGPYPASEFIYGFVWPSAEKTALMGDALRRALAVRFQAAEWLFAERIPDWELGLLAVSEFHSGAEALWHGVDPDHPLHHHPSAGAARSGLEALYVAADQALAKLLDRLRDTDVVLFNLHGMGSNDSDPGSMLLLSELLFRRAFHKPLVKDGSWATDAAGVPLLQEGSSWEREIMARLPYHIAARHWVKRIAGRMRLGGGTSGRIALDWMPAARYAPYWPTMPAFALPSFYDGRIRINLIGRERRGLVDPSEYDRTCTALEALLLACTDPRTGAPAVARVERNARPPLQHQASDADLIVIWRNAPLGLDHPSVGTIGPVPYRRTGGHTGGDGFAWFFGPQFRPAHIGRRSAFDLVPTILDLMGLPAAGVSGESFAARMREEERHLLDA